MGNRGETSGDGWKYRDGLAHRRELLNKATGLLNMLGLGSMTVA